MDNNKTFWYIYIFIILLAIGGMCITYQNEAVADEVVHWFQIERFLNNSYTMQPAITMPPGYHIIIFESMNIFGVSSFDYARIFTTLFLVLTLIPAFYAITRSWRKTLQFFFFPLFFIFYFLVYTDLTSLLFIIMAIVALHYKKYNLSGIFFILSMLIRQNNFVWLIFGGVYILVEYCIYKEWKIFNTSTIKYLFNKCWTYMIGIILFGIFIILNQGLVIGDRDSHPMGLYTTNIYYILFLTFFMFLPIIILRFKDIILWIKSHKIISIIIIISGILLALFNFTNNHWYNNTTYQGSIINTGILHNILLHIAIQNSTTRILFFIPIIIAVFYIIITKLKKPIYYLIYPFSILTIIESQMVDSRYYTIPFALFLIFREEGIDREEYYLLGYFILLALVMFGGVLRHTLMW
jgi:alpha-1,2-glucosyltransferase